MNPLVSILIPTYNRQDLIADTLNSILNQTYQNWECIIIDDGSTDSSKTRIQKYVYSDARFSYFSRPDYKRKGPSSCRNFGLEKASGEYILFLDSDDLISETCLQNRIEFALREQEYDFWIFKMAAFKNTIDNVEFEYENIIAKNESLFCKEEFMKGRTPFVITGPMWRKSVLVQLNGFNEQMNMIEDPDLHLRALKAGFKLKFSNNLKADSYYRLSNFKMRYKVNLELRNSLIFFETHLNKSDKEIFISFKKTINNLIFENSEYKYYFKFCKLGLKHQVITIHKVAIGFLVLGYRTLSLYKIKYSGYHTLKKIFNDF